MATDGRAEYCPLKSKDGKGELESIGILLPPLQQDRSTTDLSSNRWRRMLSTTVLIACIVIVLIATAIAVVLLTNKSDHQPQNDTNINNDVKIEEHTMPEPTFGIRLRRVYNKIMDSYDYDFLKNIFEYYKNESENIKTTEDLHTFLVLLKPEGLDFRNDNLSFTHVNLVKELTRELSDWYTYLYDVKKNLTTFDGIKSVVYADVKMDVKRRREMDKIIEEWSKFTVDRSVKDRVVFVGRVIRLSEVWEVLKSDIRREIYVFALDLLYLDHDIVAPGSSVAIIAPKWVYIRPVGVFLSGSSGEGFGISGGDGGDFLGVGELNEKFIRVYSDGGDGSDGQDGLPGRNGTNGKYSFNIDYGCRIHVKDVVNKYGEVISYYKVYDIFSCGGNGTNGGNSGHGGDGGTIILMDIHNGVRRYKGSVGKNGKAGKGGIPGVGVENACFFYAEKSKNNMYRVSKQLCDSTAPSGFPGLNGVTITREDKPESKFISKALQKYRTIQRDKTFLIKIDDLDNITTTDDMVDELSSEEPWVYYSLNRRIERAINVSRDKDVLICLRALSFGRMLQLKHEFDRFVIVDLDMFLDKVSSDLDCPGYTDHSLPILKAALREKVEYLENALRGWISKSYRFRTKSRIEYLTSITAERLLSMLNDSYVYTNKPNESWTNGETSTMFQRHEEDLLLELSQPEPRLKFVKRLLIILNSLSKNLDSDFIFDIDYLETTLHLKKTVEEKEKFRKYIEDVQNVTVPGDLERMLFDLVIMTQYENALCVFRQWVFPHISAYELPKNVTAATAKSAIQVLRKYIKEYKSTITSYDKYIREANFSPNNSVGEYYKWHNSEIQPDLKELFAGKKVSLTADVQNFHIYTKNAIKFKTVKLEFRSKRQELQNLLQNVQVEMVHSGYNYYYYNGQVYLQTGEGFEISYSYETGSDNQPSNCNMVYKKLLNGPAIFSPYTTWTIRLNGIPDALTKYIDDTDVLLVGHGTYVQSIDSM